MIPANVSVYVSLMKSSQPGGGEPRGAASVVAVHTERNNVDNCVSWGQSGVDVQSVNGGKYKGNREMSASVGNKCDSVHRLASIWHLAFSRRARHHL